MLGTEKIIIISDNPKLRGCISALLMAEGFFIAGECSGGIDAVRLVRRVMPDLLIVDDDLSGLGGFDMASIFIEEEAFPVLLLARNLKGAILSKAKKSSFLMVMKDVGDKNIFLANVHLLLNHRRKIGGLKKDILKKEQEALYAKSVNLAKGLLIAEKGFSEAQAHQFLQKESMKRGVSLETVAGEIIGDKL